MQIKKTLGIVAGACFALGIFAGCAQENAPAEPANPDTNSAGGNAEEAPQQSESVGPDGDIVENPPQHTWEDALSKALEETDGDLLKVELEPNDSVGWEYELKFVTDSVKEEYKYNPDTLEQIGFESEDLSSDSDERTKRTFTADEILDLQEAAGIARDAQAGTIIEWKIEGKQGDRVEYQFEILPDGAADDVEVTIDALSGKVLEIDD